ncbi:MAG: serine O-acetyltransferase [Alphaproteobacteria bacterium]|nr:serine O-acetyltransferase [Alphaproteobacteria bacterium]
MTTHAHSAPPPDAATIWPSLRAAAETVAAAEPALAALVTNSILSAESLGAALGKILSGKLASANVSASDLMEIFTAAHRAEPQLEKSAQYDLISIKENDPAAHDFLTPFLFFKGFHALQSHRVSHWLWEQGRKTLALYFQNRISDLFGVDIHPAAKIGQGVMMDHATGIVIGETAVVEDNVLFWHGVTLGGRGKSGGDRHPKIRKGVWLGAGSTILGPVDIGANARVAAGSTVVGDVPAGVTVVGTPAKIVSKD